MYYIDTSLKKPIFSSPQCNLHFASYLMWQEGIDADLEAPAYPVYSIIVLNPECPNLGWNNECKKFTITSKNFQLDAIALCKEWIAFENNKLSFPNVWEWININLSELQYAKRYWEVNHVKTQIAIFNRRALELQETIANLEQSFYAGISDLSKLQNKD